MSEKTKEELQEGDFKVKKKRGRPKKLVSNEEITKVNLTKKEENATEEPSTTPMDVDASTRNGEEVGEGNAEKSTSTTESGKESGIEETSTPVLEEITPSTKEEEVKEPTETPEVTFEKEPSTPEIVLPEGINKLISFMKDTGGTIEDYARLNTNYNDLNNEQLLREYYETTKPHLDKEDIDLLMEDFSYDEELDDERDVRKRKIAYKEELAKAQNHMQSLKSKYYDEIKAGSRLTPEQQKAVEFFNRYNKENEESTKVAEQQKNTFLKKTNDLFNNDFKGFEYSVGDKRYRFNVKDVDNVKNTQSDINNFVKKFLNDKNEMSDAKGYHKSLFTAMNADAIAQHFYEQGKADAIKSSVARAKNVDMEPRRGHEKTTTSNGWTVRSVNGVDTSKLRMKIRK